MKICVVPDNRITQINSVPDCDLLITGFRCMPVVDYESELSGKSERFEELARLSQKNRCGLICGCETDSRGLMRKSAAVADNGKLLGISDMLNVLDNEQFKSGAGLGIYTLGGFKAGICIENDLYFPEIIEALSLCGCNVAVVLMEELNDNIPALLIRSYAYLYGIPVVMCAGKLACFADITGEIASSNQPSSLFETDPKNVYRLTTSRRRGLWRNYSHDY